MALGETVFVIDDDPGVRDSLTFLLRAAQLKFSAFSSAREFLASDPATWIGCVVADVRMPDMDGLELQVELTRRNARLPIIIITGHGDVPLAVRAMKAGAVDFLEKPISKERLMSAIQHALDSNDKLPRSILKNDAVQERVNQLTPREREVFQLLVAGKTSKIIADDLCISQRTAEVHRANIMEKMGVSNIGELIVLALGGEWPK